MKIFIEKDPTQNCWWVHMDRWAVSFHNHDGADAFVERLKSRINAPHSLDIGSNALWQEKITRTTTLERRAESDPSKHLSHA